jgi:hypothetical protein
MPDHMPPDAESLRPALEGLLSSLPRVRITPQTITQPVINDWYRREARYREQVNSLCAHLDTDHAVMVALGRIAEAAVTMLEHVTMDTEEDREFHARAVGALRSRLDEIAATMKEANEMAREEVPSEPQVP